MQNGWIAYEGWWWRSCFFSIALRLCFAVRFQDAKPFSLLLCPLFLVRFAFLLSAPPPPPPQECKCTWGVSRSLIEIPTRSFSMESVSYLHVKVFQDLSFDRGRGAHCSCLQAKSGETCFPFCAIKMCVCSKLTCIQQFCVWPGL